MEKVNWKDRVDILRYERNYEKRKAVCLHNTRKYIRVDNKRQNPLLDKCELCNLVKKLSYHHWDDNIPHLGLWLCIKCHRFADRVEGYLQNKIFREKYLQLKQEIESGKP